MLARLIPWLLAVIFGSFPLDHLQRVQLATLSGDPSRSPLLLRA